jgi:hypothetical protein
VMLPSGVNSFDAADVNHDALIDLVFAAADNVIVVFGMPGGWATPLAYRATTDTWGSGSFDVAVADVTGDGHVDIFAGNGALLEGRGDGTFGFPNLFMVELDRPLIADWNRDGLLDVVTPRDAILNERRDTNRAPVANAGDDRTFTYQSQFAQDDGVLSDNRSFDPDLHRFTSEWRDENGVVFGVGDFVNIPPKPPGTYTYTLTVRDDHGGESTDEFQVTILPEPEIVLYTRPGEESFLSGNWREVADTTAAEGVRVFYPNAGAAKVTTPLVEPTSLISMIFAADPTQTYKLWVRLKAQDNRGANDSIWMQFSGAVDTTGAPNYRIGRTEGLEINLEECLGCGVSGWGWEDDGWGAINRNGTLLRFPAGGVQRLWIQVREDGVSVDQIVLSAVKYRTTRPGAAKNDATILDKTQHWPQ